jgi:site-specific recombinase XerD
MGHEVDIQLINKANLDLDWEGLAHIIKSPSHGHSTQKVLIQHAKTFSKWLKLNNLIHNSPDEVIQKYLQTKGGKSTQQHIWALKILFKNLPSIKNDLEARKTIDYFFKDKKIRGNRPDMSVYREAYLIPEEMNHILNYATRQIEERKPGGQREFTTAIIMKALFDSGCRISELIDMCHDNIKKTLAGRYAITVNGKGKKNRTVMLEAFTYDLVRTYIPSNNTLLFTNHRHKPIDRSNISKSVMNLTEKTIGRRLGAHALRHSKAMEMLSRGISIKKVSKYLGHSDIATTIAYYVHEGPTEEDVFG